MRLYSSIWIWSSFLLVCSYISYGKSESCDAAFRKALINDFRNTIFEELKESLIMEFSTALDNKMAKINEKIDIVDYNTNEIKQQLETLTSELNCPENKINEKLDIVDDRTEEAKQQLETLTTELDSNENNINEKLDIVDDRTEEANQILETLTTELDSPENNINEKLDIVEKIASRVGCPEGYFMIGEQCFKFYGSPERSWAEAKAKCQAEGLTLAKPLAPKELRKYIIEPYGPSTDSWVGASGVGSSVRWVRDGTTLGASNPSWASAYPGRWTSSSYCLVLATTEDAMKAYPDASYYMATCTGSYHTICELDRE